MRNESKDKYIWALCFFEVINRELNKKRCIEKIEKNLERSREILGMIKVT